jgi:trehalose 6-phosphate synthase/phosphatase
MVWRFWTGAGDHPDRQWAKRQAAEAQNHIFDRYLPLLLFLSFLLITSYSLGERYGLRIIPGRNSFLVLPNNVSRSTAVGAILHPGGPTRSPNSINASWMMPSTSEGLSLSTGRLSTIAMSRDETSFAGAGGYGADGYGAGGYDESTAHGEVDFLLAISSDEKLLRRLNEFDGSETVSTSGKGTDAKWRLESEAAVGVLKGFAGVY